MNLSHSWVNSVSEESGLLIYDRVRLTNNQESVQLNQSGVCPVESFRSHVGLYALHYPVSDKFLDVH